MKKSRHEDFVLIEKIQALAELLRTGNQSAWASHLLGAVHTCHSDIQLAQDVLRFYEGQGSLNEIVLYVNGRPEWRINKELVVRRDDLWVWCRAHVAVAGAADG